MEYSVLVTDHALARWRQRIGPGDVDAVADRFDASELIDPESALGASLRHVTVESRTRETYYFFDAQSTAVFVTAVDVTAGQFNIMTVYSLELIGRWQQRTLRRQRLRKAWSKQMRRGRYEEQG